MRITRPSKTTIPIESLIHAVRSEKVILDVDLARIYGVTTKGLNEQVKRNVRHFPAHFAFRLSKVEMEWLTGRIAKSDITSNRSQIATGSQKHRDPLFSATHSRSTAP
jgi:ORF6N domain-containing protein